MACYDTSSISVNEDIHYYDSDLSGKLQDAIKDGFEIYVDDLHQCFIDDAMRELYEDLAERLVVYDPLDRAIPSERKN